MLLTEAEAKQKRCTPMAAVIPVLLLREGAHDAAVASNVAQSRCVGSACMQWTWYDYVNAEGNTHRVPNDSTTFSKGRQFPTPSSVRVPGRGFCGLTGGRE